MAQQWRLLDLPSELRNHIYTYTIVGEVTLIDDNESNDWKGPPALLQTCQQIRQEAFELYWANSFRIYSSHYDTTKRAQELLEAVPSELLKRMPRIYVEPRINASRSMSGLVPMSKECPEDWWLLGALAKWRGLPLSKFVFESQKLDALRAQLASRPGFWALKDPIEAEEDYLECRERAFVMGIAGRPKRWVGCCWREFDWFE